MVLVPEILLIHQKIIVLNIIIFQGMNTIRLKIIELPWNKPEKNHKTITNGCQELDVHVIFPCDFSLSNGLLSDNE
jgi:hypothetical protein